MLCDGSALLGVLSASLPCEERDNCTFLQLGIGLTSSLQETSSNRGVGWSEATEFHARS